MLLLQVLTCGFLTVLAVNGHDCQCDKGIKKYYEELGCKPKNDEAACCPTEYDCTPAKLSTRNAEKCHLRGVTYEPESKISREVAGDDCVPQCNCQKFGPQASFQCTHSDCPEFFQAQLSDNCIRLYSHGSCCSTGKHCDNATVTASPNTKPAKTCVYDKKTYVVGQQISSKKEVPCKRCICSEAYDGTLNGPWCKEFSCGIELHYGKRILDGCAPIHFGENSCCPIDWRCPASTDTVVPAPSTQTRTTSAKCAFGKLSLNVNDKLSKEKDCVECSCSVPPLVTCVQKGYC